MSAQASGQVVRGAFTAGDFLQVGAGELVDATLQRAFDSAELGCGASERRSLVGPRFSLAALRMLSGVGDTKVVRGDGDHEEGDSDDRNCSHDCGADGLGDGRCGA